MRAVPQTKGKVIQEEQGFVFQPGENGGMGAMGSTETGVFQPNSVPAEGGVAMACQAPGVLKNDEGGPPCA